MLTSVGGDCQPDLGGVIAIGCTDIGDVFGFLGFISLAWWFTCACVGLTTRHPLRWWFVAASGVPAVILAVALMTGDVEDRMAPFLVAWGWALVIPAVLRWMAHGPQTAEARSIRYTCNGLLCFAYGATMFVAFFAVPAAFGW
jgi:hypothetical protein